MFEMMASYIEDLRSNLLLLNDSLIRIQNGQRDSDVVNGVFRVAHTIKGNSAAMEFNKIEKVMHTMEDVLQDVRSGQRELSDRIIDVLFASHDFLEDCLEILGRDSTDSGLDITSILSRIHAVEKGADVVEVHPSVEAAHVVERVEYPFSIAYDSKAWKQIVEFHDRGMLTYWMKIVLDERCAMKAVRAWLILDKLSHHGEIMGSIPQQGVDGDFDEESFAFEGYTLQTLIVLDREIDEVIRDVKATVDVIDVTVSKLDLSELETYARNESNERSAQMVLRNIGLALLAYEQTGGDETIIDTLMLYFTQVGNCEMKGVSQVFFAAVDGANTILQEMKEDQRLPVSEDTICLSYIVKLLDEGLENPERTYELDFMSELQDKLAELRHESHSKLLGDILQTRGILDEGDINEILAKQRELYQDRRFGEVAVLEGKTSSFQVISALQGQKAPPVQPMDQMVKPSASPLAAHRSAAESVFIRVPVNKVDSLMDMLGELLILNSQSEQLATATYSTDNRMLSVLTQTAKLIKEIQSLSMSLRLIEIKPTLHRLTRIARDTATELGKRINVVLEGEETEIDRSAAEKLFDPLMHLVRNAVSHGIEDTSEERAALGKRAEGQVTVRAYNSKGNVYIEVIDDGKGIDPAKILAKAKRNGLVEEGADLTPDEIIRLIFLPGFSTQEQVNSISGRGVGMNVVEEEMKHLSGRVDVYSKVGEGSVFTLRIPMNLAVVNGTIVEINEERFIIPTLYIKEFAMIESYRWISMQGRRRAIQMRDEDVIPVLEPAAVFGQGYDYDGTRNELVIMEIESKRLAFPVDRILARQEIVAKALDGEFAQIGFVSGASILGDGKVSLILDVESMFKLAGM